MRAARSAGRCLFAFSLRKPLAASSMAAAVQRRAMSGSPSASRYGRYAALSRPIGLAPHGGDDPVDDLVLVRCPDLDGVAVADIDARLWHGAPLEAEPHQRSRRELFPAERALPCAIQRGPGLGPAGPAHHICLGQPRPESRGRAGRPAMTRIITGLFDKHRTVDLVVEHLVQEFDVPRERVQVHAADPASGEEAHSTQDDDQEVALPELGLPEEAARAYGEGMR